MTLNAGRPSPQNLRLRQVRFEERNEGRMENMAEIPAQACAMPRFEDGAASLQELIRRLAEDVANGILDAEADQMCEATGNSRNGYRTRMLKTCVGELFLRVPKLRPGSGVPTVPFLP